MSTYFAIVIGIVVYAVLMALLLAVIRMNRTPNEQEVDDFEQIAAVSKPAPLTWDNAYSKRPHIRAGEKQ
jgi:hypothetical protein